MISLKFLMSSADGEQVLAEKGLSGDLSGRPKNLWGVYRKMLQKGYGLDKVYDVRALRVVVESKADCYEVLREVRVSHAWQWLASFILHWNSFSDSQSMLTLRLALY